MSNSYIDSDHYINQETSRFVNEKKRKQQLESLERRLVSNQNTQARRQSNTVESITKKAIQDLVSGGVDEESAKLAVSLIKKRQVGNISFFY